jgi:branched-subunit amino acid transport protein
MSGTGLWPYLILILAGYLPNEVWRWLGVVFSRGVREDSEVLVWVRAVATALLAAVIAKIVLLPPGALAAVPAPVRLAAVGAGFVGFLAMKRSLFAGVAIGEAMLVIGALLTR